MRTTLNIDNDLLKPASSLTGITEKTALVKSGLKALIALENAVCRIPLRIRGRLDKERHLTKSKFFDFFVGSNKLRSNINHDYVGWRYRLSNLPRCLIGNYFISNYGTRCRIRGRRSFHQPTLYGLPRCVKLF